MYDCSYTTEPSKGNLNSRVGNIEENNDMGYKTVQKAWQICLFILKNIPVYALSQTKILTHYHLFYKKKSYVLSVEVCGTFWGV